MGIEACREPFQRAYQRVLASPWFHSPWVCLCGLWPANKMATAVVLKLRKIHWSSDPVDAIRSTNGVFFSVWVDEASARRQRLRYNLHALKLRDLPGYAIKSSKFAADFRAAFAKRAREWSYVSTDFGPQTLFQGFLESPTDRWDTTIAELATAFLPLGEVVDDLLAARREPA